jgi:hypothetical protein
MVSLGRRGLLVLGAGLLTGCSDSSAQNAGGSPFTPSPLTSSAASTPTLTLSPTPVPPSPTPPSPTPPSPTPPSPTPPSPSPPSPSASASGTPVVALPAVRSWTPGAGEIQPEVKRLAVEATVDLLRRPGTRSVVEVIDAQYGGLLTNSASVLVPCRVYTLSAGRVVSGGTTVDVRLTKSRGSWRVTATHPAQPGAATSRLSTAARRVLANDNIALPPASAADIRSGQVHDTVLTAMLELAKTYRIGISVIRSGHPLNVFGTNAQATTPAAEPSTPGKSTTAQSSPHPPHALSSPPTCEPAPP